MIEAMCEITTSDDNVWGVPVDADEEVAAAQAAVTELQTRLATLGLTIPKAGSTIKVYRRVVASPYEIPAAVWEAW